MSWKGKMFLLSYQLVLETVRVSLDFGGVVQFLVVCPLVAIMEVQVKDAVRRGLFTGCVYFV